VFLLSSIANGKLSAMTDGPRFGSNVRTDADANRKGGNLCDFYAYAIVTSYTPVPTSYSILQTNTPCPAGSASLGTISGTEQIK